jgi:hypothetical protein
MILYVPHQNGLLSSTISTVIQLLPAALRDQKQRDQKQPACLSCRISSPDLRFSDAICSRQARSRRILIQPMPKYQGASKNLSAKKRPHCPRPQARGLADRRSLTEKEPDIAMYQNPHREAVLSATAPKRACCRGLSSHLGFRVCF